MKEVFKNVLVGSVVLGAMVLITQGIVYLPTLFGYTEKTGAYIFFGMVGAYLTYSFGGLTRAIYFKNN